MEGEANGRAFFFLSLPGVVQSKSLSEAVALSQSVESGRGRTLVRPFFPFQSLSFLSPLSLSIYIFSFTFFDSFFLSISQTPFLFSLTYPLFSLEENINQNI